MLYRLAATHARRMCAPRSTAAAAVLADLPVSARGVLAGLVRAHLAEAAPSMGDRWRMHDLVRLYARRNPDT